MDAIKTTAPQTKDGEAPVLAFTGQPPQYVVNPPMEGTLIYAIDKRAYASMVTGYAPPVGTFATCLGALSMYTWDVPTLCMWVAAALTSLGNIWFRRNQVVRMSVTLSRQPDPTKCPRHPHSIPNPLTVTHLHIERFGLPLMDRKVSTVEVGPMTRVEDQSYLLNRVFPIDVKEACDYPGLRRIVFDTNSVRNTVFVENVRHTDYFNQILTYARSPVSKR
jgi:hypothetical protein